MEAMAPSVADRPVLVIDDDENDIFLLRRLLKVAAPSKKVLTFVSSEEALTYLNSASAGSADVPLVVFLDIKMPRRDGFYVLRMVRSRQQFDRVSVCMLSGSAERADIDLARTLGAECYLEKHPSAEVVRQLLAAAERSAAQGKQAFGEVPTNLFA